MNNSFQVFCANLKCKRFAVLFFILSNGKHYFFLSLKVLKVIISLNYENDYYVVGSCN